MSITVKKFQINSQDITLPDDYFHYKYCPVEVVPVNSQIPCNNFFKQN